jgi:hypothetical protein
VILGKIDIAFFRPAAQLLYQGRFATARWSCDDDLSKVYTAGIGHSLEPVDFIDLDGIKGHLGSRII